MLGKLEDMLFAFDEAKPRMQDRLARAWGWLNFAGHIFTVRHLEKNQPVVHGLGTIIVGRVAANEGCGHESSSWRRVMLKPLLGTLEINCDCGRVFYQAPKWRVFEMCGPPAAKPGRAA